MVHTIGLLSTLTVALHLQEVCPVRSPAVGIPLVVRGYVIHIKFDTRIIVRQSRYIVSNHIYQVQLFIDF